MDISESGSQQKYEFLYPGYLTKTKKTNEIWAVQEYFLIRNY